MTEAEQNVLLGKVSDWFKNTVIHNHIRGIRILVLMWYDMTFHNNIKMKCSVAKLGLFV
jgi:hypothetical protein